MSTDGDLSDQSAQRVSDADRQAAVAALGEHWKAGRLDPAEHERRTTAAYQAVTRGDLAALFTDLPGGLPDAATTGAGQSLRPGASETSPRPERSERSDGPVADDGDGPGGLFPAGSWVATHRSALMGVSPFVAILLFFVTKWWVWFLLIPAMGVILYAGGDQDGRDRRRRRDRYEG